ncbi:MAG: ABC transporter permease subunit [Hyphomonadaceae bacterium]|nr:ABC transporter permease subunit [Hyphomonadaceae bacterium]
MLALAARRLVIAIPTLLVIIAAAFFLMRAAPGGPFTAERQMPPEIERRLLAKYDLDQPPAIQFVNYLGDLARGDLGPSMKYKDKTVAEIIGEGFPTSAILGLSAVALALLVGGALGVMAALRQNRPQDYAVMALALLGVCLPPLVMGPVLSLLFGIELGWLPTGGLARDEMSFAHMILPVVTLALPQIAIVSRLMRASMIEAVRSNAIRTARAKGLPEAQVIWRHALPVAMLPVVSYLGPAIAGVLTGSFVIESVFQLPGVGRQFVIGALSRDYTLVMGVVILYACLIIALNLAADLLYSALDPRVRRA